MLKNELRAQRATLLDQAKVIVDQAQGESRTMSADETKKFDGLMTQAEEMRGTIERIDRIEIESAKLGESAGRRIEAADREGAEVAVVNRVGKLRAFRWADGKRDAYHAGMVFAATALRNTPFGTTAHEWCEQHGHGDELRILTTGVSTKGATLVPSGMERAIIDNREMYGVARQVMNVRPMAESTTTTPRRTGGLTAYLMDEVTAGTESDKAWDSVTLTAKNWGVLCRYSKNLNDDAIISMADDLADEGAYALTKKEDDCLFIGDGSATYGGVQGLCYKLDPDTTASLVGSVDAGTAGHDTFAEIDGDDLDLVLSVCPKYARARGAWYISGVGQSLVFNPLLRAAGGNTGGDVSTGFQARYMSYPIIEVPSMPSGKVTDYNNSVMALFGDINRAAVMGERRGIEAQVLYERYAEYGQLGIILSERVAITVHDVGDTSAAGPIVALVGFTS